MSPALCAGLAVLSTRLGAGPGLGAEADPRLDQEPSSSRAPAPDTWLWPRPGLLGTVLGTCTGGYMGVSKGGVWGHLGQAPLGAVVGGGHVVGGDPPLGEGGGAAAYTRVPTSPAAVS